MYTFHKIVYTILRPLVAVFLRFKFGYRWQRMRELPKHYIVLANHATNFDPVFVGAAFPHLYFVGSEHISRWGFVSGLLRFFLAPILRPKGAVASATVKKILQTLRSGKNVCLFAEGSCSWDGTPNPILPSTGKMVQKAGCALVTFRLTGGFFAYPRWSTSGKRKGPVCGAGVRVYTAEQLAAMSVKEINDAIIRDLGEDAYDRQLAHPRPYRSRRAAEGLEYLLYRCPKCGGLDTLRTCGNTVECGECGLRFDYDRYGMLRGAPFETLKAYHCWQRAQCAEDAARGLRYTASGGALTAVAGGAAVPVDQGSVAMDGETLTCGETEIPMDEISDMDIHGKNVLVFTAGKSYYELKPEGNGLKFLMLYREYAGMREKLAQMKHAGS